MVSTTAIISLKSMTTGESDLMEDCITAVDEKKKYPSREFLLMLVTMGARAAYMECAGRIRLPAGLQGEEELGDFCCCAIQEYIDMGQYSMNFDEFIEMELQKEYGTEVSMNGGLDIEKRG